jgi:hypothetical protein
MVPKLGLVVSRLAGDALFGSRSGLRAKIRPKDHFSSEALVELITQDKDGDQ